MYNYFKLGLLFSILSIFLLGFGYAATDNNFDLTVKSITISPSSPDAGDTVTVKCTIESLGSKEVEFDDLEVTFYIDDGEDKDDYQVNDGGITFTYSGDTEKYEYDFDTDVDFDGNVEFSCEITDYDLDNDYSDYDDLNTTNDDASLEITFNSVWDKDGIDLGIYDVDVDDTSPNRGQEIDITCTYANFGDNDADASIGDATLYWLIDNENVNDVKLGDIDDGKKGERTYTYTIPYNYNEEEMEVGCKIYWDPEDNDDKDTSSGNNKKYMTIDVSGVYYDNSYSSTYNYSNNSTNTIDSIYPNLIINSISIVNQPLVIDESNILSCSVQNFSQATTKDSYTVNLYVDNIKVGNWTTNNVLTAQDYDSFDTSYVFMTAGDHTVKCSVLYNGLESELNDNEKVQTIFVANKTTYIGGETKTNENSNLQEYTTQNDNKQETITPNKTLDYKMITIIVLGVIVIIFLIYLIIGRK